MAMNARTAAVLIRTLNQACRRARQYPQKHRFAALAFRAEQELWMRLYADRLFARSRARALAEADDLPLLTDRVA